MTRQADLQLADGDLPCEQQHHTRSLHIMGYCRRRGQCTPRAHTIHGQTEAPHRLCHGLDGFKIKLPESSVCQSLCILAFVDLPAGERVLW